MNWIIKLFSKISAFFGTPAGAVVKDALTTVLERTQKEVLDMLFNEAKTRVTLVENTGLTGDAKRDEVAQYLAKLLNDKGLDVGRSVINYAIENAIQALKK